MKIIYFLNLREFNVFKKEIEIFKRLKYVNEIMNDDFSIEISKKYSGVSKYAIRFISNSTNLDLESVIRVLLNKEISQILYVKSQSEIIDSMYDFLGWLRVYYHMIRND